MGPQNNIRTRLPLHGMYYPLGLSAAIGYTIAGNRRKTLDTKLPVADVGMRVLQQQQGDRPVNHFGLADTIAVA